MPTPDATTQFITIDDFSPGIHSDFHSGVAPRYTAADTQAGALLGKPGLAQVDGTERCHADKTGALVPLPKAQTTGIRDSIGPAAIEATRPYRYVLDAQIGSLLADDNEVASAPFAQVYRQPIEVMWGFYANQGSSSKRPIVIGRQYDPWVTYPPVPSQQHQAITDFIVAAAMGFSDGLVEAQLPIGSLTRARFYYGFTTSAFGDTTFTVTAANDSFLGQQQFVNDEPVVISGLTGAAPLVNGTVYYIRDTGTLGNVESFKLAATRGGAVIDITSDGSGTITRVENPIYNPLWMYPVSVAMAATPWARWGLGNEWANGIFLTTDRAFYGVADPLMVPHVYWPPAIGLNGRGPVMLAMNLTDDARLHMPFLAQAGERWFFHRSEIGNVPQNNVIWDRANGPINPYMLITHQGRILMPDRRRTPTAWVSGDSQSFGYADDLLFYSDVHLPMQNFRQTALSPDRGVNNIAYGTWAGLPLWNPTSMLPYNALLAPEDVVADVGTIAISTVDQMLVVKHVGGGALIAGDLDQPTIHRLPYIESTGGVICKGAQTPVGYVYGSRNGIFLWNGGDSTERISPQLDGFFWDHTDGSVFETYAGSRGRMAYWNGLVCVPNNYVLDIDSQSWWRLAVPTLDPIAVGVKAPFNCYDTDPNNILYAFPYRHTAQNRESGLQFPVGPTEMNVMQINDPLGAGSERDIRFCVDNVGNSAGTTRTIVGQWGTAGFRSWRVQLSATNEVQAIWSTDGSATAATSTSTDTLSGNAPICVRVSWSTARAAGQEVIIEIKSGSGPIRQLLESNFGWVPLGNPVVGPTAALFNSTDELVFGNRGNDSLTAPLINQTLYACRVATTLDAAPVVAIYPDDFPNALEPATMIADTGHTVTFQYAASGTKMNVAYKDQATTPPVWYTYDPDVLDSFYSWQSHPIIPPTDDTVPHSHSIQDVQVIATATSGTGSNPTVTVILRGYDMTGTFINGTPIALTLDVEQSHAQLLREDIDNSLLSQCDYFTVELNANDPNGNPAPKIHSVRIGYKSKARTPRHG